MAKIHLPWGAWYEDSSKILELPESWQVDVYTLQRAVPLTDDQIRKKLADLKTLVASKRPKSVVIVVDDLTRPVILARLLESLLDILHQTGLSANSIRFLIGLGTHRPLTDKDMAKKLGDKIVKKYICLNHNPEETDRIGEVWGKTEVRLNRHYLQADFKIVISGLTPHSFAGFSGGAKMLIPGLADMEIVAKTHKSVMMGFMGKLGEVENNRFRRTIEKLIEKVGLDFFIGVVLNGDRSIADLFTGDYIEAHRQAAQAARQLYQVKIEENAPYDIVFLNAFPKDTELLQAENAFIPLKSAGSNLLKEGGIVVLTSACSEGMGYHGLFQPGGKLYHPPRPMRFLKDKRFVFYSPNISSDEFYKLFWKEYSFFDDTEPLMNYLAQNAGKQARVAVFPYASLQLARI